MEITKVLITGRMVEELKRLQELDSGGRQYAFVPEADVAWEHYDWADAYVAFKPTASFRFGGLKWVHALGAGVDAFLYRREWKQDVLLTRTIGSFGQKIGEYCLSYILADVKQHRYFDALQRERSWQPSASKLLSELTVVIYGAGTIGQELARMLRQFGVRVYGVSRSGRHSDSFDRVYAVSEAAEVLPQADWVVSTLPLTTETAGLFGGGVFDAMRGAGFVNAGRGASVDEAALLRALDRGRVRTAVLDVFTEEPLPVSSPLWGHPSIRITPHISAVTSADEAIDGFLSVVRALDRGISPERYTVNLENGY